MPNLLTDTLSQKWAKTRSSRIIHADNGHTHKKGRMIQEGIIKIKQIILQICKQSGVNWQPGGEVKQQFSAIKSI